MIHPDKENRKMKDDTSTKGKWAVSWSYLLHIVTSLFEGYVTKTLQKSSRSEILHNFIESYKQDLLSHRKWKNLKTSLMNAVDVFEYLMWSNKTSCLISQDFGGSIIKLKDKYGKYAIIEGSKAVCLDPGIAPDGKICIVYSFGVRDEWSFDDAMEKYGCRVFSFDPSMKIPQHTRNKKIHFYPIGLDSENRLGWEGDSKIQMKTLSEIFRMLQNQFRLNITVKDYLKIDIEWMEWHVIPEIIKSGMLPLISQLNMDVHLSENDTIEDLRQRVNTLKFLEDSGMVRFDSKPNPFGNYNFSRVGYWIHQ